MTTGIMRSTVVACVTGFAAVCASAGPNPPGSNQPRLNSEQSAQAIMNIVTSQEAGVESLNSHGNFIAYQLVLRERHWEYSCAAGTQQQVLTFYRPNPQNPGERLEVEHIDVSDTVLYPSGPDFLRICLESPLQRLSGVSEDTWSGNLGRHFVVAAQIEHLPFVPCALLAPTPTAPMSLSYTQYWPFPVMAALGVKTFLMSRRPGDDQFCSAL